MDVQTANSEMARQWDGEEGDDWTENAERYEATDRYLWRRFEAEVPVGEADRVLDVGCGTGKSTRAMARAARRGRVVGIDLSTRMLDYARRRSLQEGLSNVDYVRGDAQVHPFPEEEFDLAVSVFGATFFADPVAAFANIRRGLRPGGRLALLAWQPFERNEWLTLLFATFAAGRSLPTPAPGRPGPFGLADDGEVRRILAGAGFGGVRVAALDAPLWMGADAREAWEFLSGLGIVRGLSADLGAASREDALGRLREALEGRQAPEGVLLGGAEWLITATVDGP